MADTIRLKRSGVQGKLPTTAQLELGELALNTYDGRAYIKKDDGTEAIVDITAFLGSVAESIQQSDITNWNDAFSWGNHASENYEKAWVIENVSTSIQAVSGIHYNVSTASLTLTLPLSPTAGDRVAISVGNFVDTVVDNNGENINGQLGTLSIDYPNSYVELRYIGGTDGWKIVALSKDQSIPAYLTQVYVGDVLPDPSGFTDGDIFFVKN